MDQNANKFQETLCHFGLFQHVNEPLHIKGHILDLAIMPDDCNVKNIYFYLPTISDHVSLHNANNEKYLTLTNQMLVVIGPDPPSSVE